MKRGILSLFLTIAAAISALAQTSVTLDANNNVRNAVTNFSHTNNKKLFVDGVEITAAPSFPNEVANTILAGPTSGGVAQPTFRALVTADIPSLPESQITNLVSDLAAKASSTDPRLSDDRTANAIQTATVKSIDNSADPLDGQIFHFDSASGKWKLFTLTGGGNVTGSGLTSGNVIQGSGGTAIADGGFAIADIARLSIADIFTNIAAPGTPAAGKNALYFDSTSKNISAKNDAGTVNHGVQTQSVVPHKAISAIADNGAVTVAQFSATDLADFSTTEASSAGQIPIFDGSKYVPGDPLVQGLYADGSTSAANPVAIGAYDTAGTPVLHRLIALASAPAGTESALVVRNIPSGTQAVSGTFWQSTQPVSVADGQNVTLGAKADAKNTATDTTAISIMSVLKQISASVQAPPSQAVTNAGIFAVQVQDTSGNGITSNSTTYTAKKGLDVNVLGTLGTAFSSAGKVDVKGADGDVFVRQTTGSNLHVNVDSAPSTAVTGTFWQATQPVSIADGSEITLGAKADAKSTATDTTPISIMSVLKQISASVQAPPSQAVTNAGTFPVQVQDTSGNGITSNSTTYTAKKGLDVNVLGTLGTAFSSAGKVDVKGADGDVFVRQTTGSNLHVNVDSAPSTAVTGTFWQATQPVSIADGSDTTLGAKADAKSTATDTTAISIMSVLKQISASVQAPPSQAVTNAGTFPVQAAQSTAAAGTAGWPTVLGNITRSSAAWTSATSLDTALSMTTTNYGTIVVTLNSTSTITQGTLNFEASDDGSTWFPVAADQNTAYTVNTTYVIPASTKQTWTVPVAGFTNFRVRLNPVITGTGTVTMGLVGSSAVSEPSVTVGQATAANLQMTVGAALPTGGNTIGAVTQASGPWTVTPQATESFLGFVGGKATNVSANFTRPADTNVYASGDLVANSTTAASVVPLSWTVARINDATGMIRRARLKISGTVITNASFRIHLYQNDVSASSGIANGDNGAWSTKEAGYLGSIDVTVDKAFTDGAEGVGIPNNGTEINFIPKSGSQLIYGLIEARAAFTPTSAEVFTVNLETLQN